MSENTTSYPPTITAHWQAITAVLASAEPQVTAILLLGSAARGELAYAQVDERCEVFSDYELLVVTRRRLPARERQRIAGQLVALQHQFAQRNPLFHIDVIFRERRRLQTLPRIIFTYELKANAQVLHGENVRPLLPEVTLANLDRRNANEILVKRLWAILLHTPRRLLRGPLTRLEEMIWGYVLCRNALDLTTVLLPRRDVLLPSYGSRVEYLSEHYAQLGLASRFGEGFPSFLTACLQERQSLSFSEPLSRRYARTIDHLATACDLLLEQADAPGISLPERLVTGSRRLFNEWPISRGEWANLARLSLQHARRNGPLAAVRWLGGPKKGIATAGLLSAHRALLAHQAGRDDEAAARLAESARLLARIALTPLPPLLPAPPGSPTPAGGGRTAASGVGAGELEDFATRWLLLRRAWGGFWCEYMQLGDPGCRTRSRFVMEWEDG